MSGSNLTKGVGVENTPPQCCTGRKKPSAFRVKQDIPINRSRNGIFLKSNTECFTEFTNCNLSQRLVEHTLLFFNDVEEHEFSSN